MTMDTAQTKRIEYVRQRVPRRVAMYERCFIGKASLAFRIKTFCLDCMGVNYRLAKTCAATTCPLYGGRPSKWSGGRAKMVRVQSAALTEAFAKVRTCRKPTSESRVETTISGQGYSRAGAQDDFWRNRHDATEIRAVMAKERGAQNVRRAARS